MENKYYRKNHIPVPDSHGVYVCHKCGWPFPNSHPSAKLRRGHKKICGTIEGYKLVKSEGSTHLTISDDERQSDEDEKTPSPRILQRSSNEKGSGAMGDRSGRSEDEVFSDAVTEFPDSGSGRRIEVSHEDVNKPATLASSIADSDTRTTLSYEDAAITTTIPPLGNSADSHIPNTEVQGSSLSGSSQDSMYHVSSLTTNFMERSLSGYRTEESVYESSDDKAGSSFDSNPIKRETQTDALQKNHEETADEVVPKTDAKGNEESVYESCDDKAGSSFDSNPIKRETQTDSLQKNHEETADEVVPETDAKGNEESVYESSDDKAGSSFGSNPIKLETQTDALQKNHEETAGEVVAETDAKGNEEIENKKNNSSQDFLETNTKVNEKKYLDRQLLDVQFSPSDNVGEASEVVSKLGEPEDKTSDSVVDAGSIPVKEKGDGPSPEVESVGHMNSSIHTSQIKMDAVQGLASGSSGNAIETSNGAERGSENVHVFSVPGDIAVVENAEAMIRGFKDLKGGRLPQLVDVDSLEVSNEVKEPVLKDNASNICSGQSTEGTEVSVSDMHVLEENLEHTGENNEHFVEKFPDEIQRREEFDAHAYAPASETEKSCTVQYPEEGVPDCKSSSNASSLEHATNLLVDVNPVAAPIDAEVRQKTNVVDVDDEGADEKTKVEKCDIAENERGKNIKQESCIENIIVISEEGKVEGYCASETETGDGDSTLGSMEGNYLVKTTMSNSANDLQEKYVASENVINALERKLTEPESIHLTRASDQEGVKELESNSTEKLQVEGSVSVNAAAESDKVGNNDELPKSSGDGDSTLGSMEGNHLVKTTMSNSANDLQENYVTSENVINALQRKLAEPESIHLTRASDQEGVKELESNSTEKLDVVGSVSVNAAAESDKVGKNDELPKSSDNVGDVELLQKPSDNIDDIKVLHKSSEKIEDVEVLQKSSEEHMREEPQLSSLDAASSVQSIETVRENPARGFAGVASESKSEALPDEGDNKFGRQQLGASATNLSVDSGSQSDSLEGHWGSVSVLSTQSDMPAIADAEPMASNGSKVSAEAENTDLKRPQVFPEGQPQSDKSDMFEPPSFMTLVEPKAGDKADASEIQTVQNMQQPKAASIQAGWFPSLTNVVNESQGRKKNEEIIAKVTNWSTGKQHTPLKNLLGEASAETKSKLQNAKENPPTVVQNDETSTKDNGSSPTTANSILTTPVPVAESIKKDAGKEWNSPARYPADIKREKRKVKGRPYWAQFVCCSSVN